MPYTYHDKLCTRNGSFNTVLSSDAAGFVYCTVHSRTWKYMTGSMLDYDIRPEFTAEVSKTRLKDFIAFVYEEKVQK